MNNSRKNESDAINMIIKKNTKKRRKYNDNFDFILTNKIVHRIRETNPTERQKIKKKTNR